MDGIDSFIDRYGLEGIAEAHQAIGSFELADALQRIVETQGQDEDALNVADRFAGSVHGYSYESIVEYVAKSVDL
jgi:hypothetical protein